MISFLFAITLWVPAVYVVCKGALTINDMTEETSHLIFFSWLMLTMGAGVLLLIDACQMSNELSMAINRLFLIGVAIFIYSDRRKKI